MPDSKRLHWLCSVPFGITLVAIGLIGNIICFFVWNRILKWRLRGNHSTAIYFIALSVCDSAVLLFFLLTDTIKSNHPEIAKTYSYAVFYSWFGFPLFTIFLVTSVWLVVGVTLNRYLMMILPLKIHCFYSKRRTYWGIFAISMFSFLINIPHFFTYHPKETNGTYMLAFTDYGESQGSINYEFWVHCMLLVLLPFFSIAFLNISLVYLVLKRLKKMKNSAESKILNANETRERRMTLTLLSITFTFLVLLAWQCVAQCFWMLSLRKADKNSSRWNQIDSSFAFAKISIIINCAINWILYCLTGTMFRKELMRLICGERQSPQTSTEKSFPGKDKCSVETDTK
ncbi:FMRFamide receptor-like [Hydractinia symbiolongicarpus]|uniref:FMRFamide receptor-like n=1 Tax=Hydractinia symbiolongicarpus TaxID=13093 RepID=UPI00254FF511|nr:FMRFamide receptor-like [Hydractinia symbiolongicarpus]